jgi:hypothetical protein
LNEATSRSVEVIVIGDQLYRRLAPGTIRDGRVYRNAYYFSGEPDPQVSVDLARLTTPEQTRSHARNPERFGVGQLPARLPIELGLTVTHAPTDDNDSHCLIAGVTTKAICQALADQTVIIINP